MYTNTHTHITTMVARLRRARLMREALVRAYYHVPNTRGFTPFHSTTTALSR